MSAVRRAVLLLTLLLLPGAASSDDADASEVTVVAVLDSGINPYHEAFRAPEGEDVVAWLPTVGLEGTTLQVLASTGSYAERVQTDGLFWSTLAQRGHLYAFPGTRVLAISFGPMLTPNDPPILDLDGHGTATAALVARENPEGIVVIVQAGTNTCALQPTRCLVDPSVTTAMSWIANRSWIDIVSVSLGFPGNAPSGATAAYHTETRAYVEASRRAHENGKLIVTSGGNDPSPIGLDFFDGPPWIVAVGGLNREQQGQPVLSSTLPDLVASYLEHTPAGDSVDGYVYSTGTSFATPIVAGVAARALGEAREAGALPTRTELRAALNATARLITSDAWAPTLPDTAGPDPGAQLVATSIPLAAGGAQEGWGAIDAGAVSAMVARLLAHDVSVPIEKADAAALRARHQTLRALAWP